MSLRLAVLLLLVLLPAACGGDAADEEAAPPPTEPGQVDTACRGIAAPTPRAEGRLDPPGEQLGEGEHRIRVETNCGTFTVTLTPETAPNATASVAALAREGFYDGTVIHRVVSGFVIQGGDPTGEGIGGPGYTTVDSPDPETTYTRGTVAMAKTGADPPGTAGSQFFVVTAGDAGLPPEYAVIGSVTEGMETIDRIEALADPEGAERPTQPVVIERMTLESG